MNNDLKVKDNTINPNASINEKKSLEYGRKISANIYSECFSSGKMQRKRDWVNKMRRFARGEDDTDYKSMIEGSKNKENSHLKEKKNYKIDYTERVNVITSLRNIVTNKIDESSFKPKVEAIDESSVNEKKKFFKNLEKSYYNRDFDKIIEDGLGVKVTNGSTANTKEKLQSKKLDYKSSFEIAQEIAIETVLKLQKFLFKKKKVNEDLFDLGVSVMSHETDPKEGVKIYYEDFYNVFHSDFEMDDGSDLRYIGVEKDMTIGQIIRISEKISPGQLNELKRLFSESKGNYDNSKDINTTVKVMKFGYLLENIKVFKRKRRNGVTTLIDRTYDGEEYSKRNRMEFPDISWYEGVYVPSIDLMLKWGRIENQVERGVNDPIPPFVINAPKMKRISEFGDVRFYSTMNKAIPILKDIQRDLYKLEQLKTELRPNSVTISPRALSNVMLGGKKVSEKDVLELFFGRGILLADTTDEDGNPLGNAITEHNGGVNNSALTFLSQEFASSLNKLRQVVGVNEFVDGTAKPSSRIGLTAQKMLELSSNNSTSHIVSGSYNISLSICEAVSLRVSSALKSKRLKSRFEDMIGTNNMNVLDSTKELSMRKFAIFFDFKPDNKDRIDFERSLIQAYSEREINSAQYNKINSIKNVKTAIQYLEQVVELNKAREENEKTRHIELQAEANSKNAILIEQTKQQTITIEYEKEANLLRLKYALEQDSLKSKSLVEELSDVKKHERNKELAVINRETYIQRGNLAEDRKDNRENLRSQNQSALIEKRKDVSKEVDFNVDKSFGNAVDDIFSKKST